MQYPCLWGCLVQLAPWFRAYSLAPWFRAYSECPYSQEWWGNGWKHGKLDEQLGVAISWDGEGRRTEVGVEEHQEFTFGCVGWRC